jgi:hypothetical protein
MPFSTVFVFQPENFETINSAIRLDLTPWNLVLFENLVAPTTASQKIFPSLQDVKTHCCADMKAPLDPVLSSRYPIYLILHNPF